MAKGNKATKFFGETMVKLITEDYVAKNFKDVGTLAKALTWDNTNTKLFAPVYFGTLVEGQGRSPGKFAPPDAILPWTARKVRTVWRDRKTGRFISRRQQAFLINRTLKEKGSQVYQGKRPGIDMNKITNKALALSAEKFGDEAIKPLLNKR